MSKHEKLKCSQCLNIAVAAHHCQALVAVCQECELHHPVIADACQSQDKIYKMPVADGTVEALVSIFLVSEYQKKSSQIRELSSRVIS